MKVGFIGLGIMGSRMTANLQKHGFELVVHDKIKQTADLLVKNGAVWAESPAKVAEQVGVLFTILPFPEIVKEVAEGENGFFQTLNPGTIWVDCSTNNPSFSKEMAKKTIGKGGRYLDASVAGSKPQAESGDLRFLVGGESADFETCRPYFSAMGCEATLIGPHGAGATMKMVFNLMIGEAILAFSEALVLGESMGISRETLFKMILSSHVAAPFLKGKAEKIAGGTYEADFPLKLMVKNLHQASISAYEQGVSLPGVGAAKETYAMVARYGLADKDYSALYSFLKKE